MSGMLALLTYFTEAMPLTSQGHHGDGHKTTEEYEEKVWPLRLPALTSIFNGWITIKEQLSAKVNVMRSLCD